MFVSGFCYSVWAIFVCDTMRVSQPNPRTLGAEELIAIHRENWSLGKIGWQAKSVARIAGLATGMRKFS